MRRAASRFEPPSFDKSAHSPRALAIAARCWEGLFVQEDRARAVTLQLVSDLARAGAPSSLVAEAERVLADEERHVRICAHVIDAFGGDVADPRTQIPTLPSETDAFEEALARLLVGGFAVGETMSIGAFASLLKLKCEPLVRWALSEIARDEVWHGRFGESASHWALRGWSPERRQTIWPVCVHAMESMEERAGGAVGEHSHDERSGVLETLGVSTVAVTGEGLLRAIPQWVLPRLARLGVLPAPVPTPT